MEENLVTETQYLNEGVGLAPDYGLGSPRLIPSRDNNYFLSSTVCRSALRSTQPLIRRVPEAVLTEIKRPKCESDHPLQSSADDKTGGGIPPIFHTSSRRGA
jgi:hypothetical protein